MQQNLQAAEEKKNVKTTFTSVHTHAVVSILFRFPLNLLPPYHLFANSMCLSSLLFSSFFLINLQVRTIKKTSHMCISSTRFMLNAVAAAAVVIARSVIVRCIKTQLKIKRMLFISWIWIRGYLLITIIYVDSVDNARAIRLSPYDNFVAWKYTPLQVPDL